MKVLTRVIGAAALVLLAAGASFLAAQRVQQQDTFPHEKHAQLFTTCTTCHVGVLQPGAPMFPTANNCASCHDGVVKPRVTWQSRTKVFVNSLKFTHERHGVAAASKNIADSAMMRTCTSCHVPSGAQRMTVKPVVINQCLDCHGLKGSHFDLDRNACSTCHLPLAQAPNLTRDAIAKFPKPESHKAPDFILGGHGKLAKPDGAAGIGVSANCATCHSRNLCLTCHVNAPDIPAIRALALDDRPPALKTTQPVPASHASAAFLRTHGKDAQKPNPNCASCHARESCLTCHIGSVPRPVSALATGGEGRAHGAQLTRTPPPSHTERFREGHGREADARPRTCETCHERSTCLTCHRPDASRQSAFHPAGFLSSHPNAAYTRSVSCARCHNTQQFCQSCHQSSGLTAASKLARRGYHDAFRGFSLGHGQAARQSLETCASCHAERDCTACHSSTGAGFGFSPHGDRFDAAKARAKNPSVCIACHGRAIPTRKR